jgi:hypothetical protein
LLQLAWFARLYRAWQSWEARIVERVRASWIWQTARRIKERWRRWYFVWAARLRGR